MHSSSLDIIVKSKVQCGSSHAPVVIALQQIIFCSQEAQRLENKVQTENINMQKVLQGNIGLKVFSTTFKNLKIKN